MLTLIVTEVMNAIVQTPNLSDFYEDHAVNHYTFLPSSYQVTILVSQVIDGNTGLLRWWDEKILDISV